MLNKFSRPHTGPPAVSPIAATWLQVMRPVGIFSWEFLQFHSPQRFFLLFLSPLHMLLSRRAFSRLPKRVFSRSQSTLALAPTRTRLPPALPKSSSRSFPPFSSPSQSLVFFVLAPLISPIPHSLISLLCNSIKQRRRPRENSHRRRRRRPV